MLMQTLSRRGSSLQCPWRLILYVDEITPGNPLRPDNKRNIMAIYASWLELGDFLRTEEAWLTLGIMRTSIMKTIRGGVSSAVKTVLRALFVGSRSMSSAGILLPAGDLLFCKFHRFLSGEGAGKAVWCCKGASGIKPCIGCKNVVQLAEGEESLTKVDGSGYLVDIACWDTARFDPMSDTDVFTAYDGLVAMQAAGALKGELEREEKARGFAIVHDAFTERSADARNTQAVYVCQGSYAHHVGFWSDVLRDIRLVACPEEVLLR